MKIPRTAPRRRVKGFAFFRRTGPIGLAIGVRGYLSHKPAVAIIEDISRLRFVGGKGERGGAVVQWQRVNRQSPTEQRPLCRPCVGGLGWGRFVRVFEASGDGEIEDETFAGQGCVKNQGV